MGPMASVASLHCLSQLLGYYLMNTTNSDILISHAVFQLLYNRVVGIFGYRNCVSTNWLRDLFASRWSVNQCNLQKAKENLMVNDVTIVSSKSKLSYKGVKGI